MLYGRRTSKPTLGVGLDRAHPLTKGLQGLWAINEGNGNTLLDATGQVPLSFSTVGNSGKWVGGNSGFALQYLQTDNVAGPTGTILPSQFCNWPITHVVAYVYSSLPPTNNRSHLGGCHSNQSGAYWAWDSYNQGGGNGIVFEFNTNGSYQTVSTGVNPTAGVNTVMAWEWNTGGLQLYINGTSVWTHSMGMSQGPLYGTNPPTYTMGLNGTTESDANLTLFWSGWWNRVLTPQEHQQLASNPWVMYTPPFSIPKWTSYVENALGGNMLDGMMLSYAY